MSSVMTRTMRWALADVSGWPWVLSTVTVDLSPSLRTWIWYLTGAAASGERLNSLLKKH